MELQSLEGVRSVTTREIKLTELFYKNHITLLTLLNVINLVIADYTIVILRPPPN